jgi:hypothetical protein
MTELSTMRVMVDYGEWWPNVRRSLRPIPTCGLPQVYKGLFVLRPYLGSTAAAMRSQDSATATPANRSRNLNHFHRPDLLRVELAGSQRGRFVQCQWRRYVVVSVCARARACVCQCVVMYVHLSIYPSIHPSIDASVHPSIYR